MNIRVENWRGHSIRFVEAAPGDWHGVIQDVCTALDIKNASQAAKRLKPKHKGICKIYTLGGEQEVLCANEFGIYKLIFRSNKPEAEQFEDWVFETISVLRKSSGLEGFQIFRMLDKDHQKEAMERLKTSLIEPVRVDFIKANTIANKAVSSVFGHPKMIKKDQMTPDMLIQRQQILEDTVNLMGVKEKFALDMSVANAIYGKYRPAQ
ncbi:Bro-N domain-containing protein [Brevibacillus porteri]|uniref:Phage repressor protein n=1 Tax=Brevibacillus porteri TaxID=2126350 RepID=A0ABX5FU42_9BACL|nr:Bro-N domain-containing protein [Brevibacillus porteri]MED1801828.1 Bro-N domain-containing protein [Brevibacillus porteri]MED2134960.1 Bro-N domain-containing protein [Brevibacillus porteri]MED2745481.1 Bro-N domain-containing protein [Brevibacillus porteri]MED2815773.1 Bro-N domain-containing protein [Brevibacillus porteri]MED2897611.1 Bro-N domain-containing protein [Brevibacillus porteri]